MPEFKMAIDRGDSDLPIDPLTEAWSLWTTKWQAITPSDSGWWTRSLINDPREWSIATRKLQLSYPLCQLLSGHGSFMKYLHRIDRAPSPFCPSCSPPTFDDAEHTFSVCPLLAAPRRKLLARLRQIRPTIAVPSPFSCRDLVQLLLSTKSSWSPIRLFADEVIHVKVSSVIPHALSLPISSI